MGQETYTGAVFLAEKLNICEVVRLNHGRAENEAILDGERNLYTTRRVHTGVSCLWPGH